MSTFVNVSFTTVVQHCGTLCRNEFLQKVFKDAVVVDGNNNYLSEVTLPVAQLQVLSSPSVSDSFCDRDCEMSALNILIESHAFIMLMGPQHVGKSAMLTRLIEETSKNNRKYLFLRLEGRQILGLDKLVTEIAVGLKNITRGRFFPSTLKDFFLTASKGIKAITTLEVTTPLFGGKIGKSSGSGTPEIDHNLKLEKLLEKLDDFVNDLFNHGNRLVFIWDEVNCLRLKGFEGIDLTGLFQHITIWTKQSRKASVILATSESNFPEFIHNRVETADSLDAVFYHLGEVSPTVARQIVEKKRRVDLEWCESFGGNCGHLALSIKPETRENIFVSKLETINRALGSAVIRAILVPFVRGLEDRGSQGVIGDSIVLFPRVLYIRLVEADHSPNKIDIKKKEAVNELIKMNILYLEVDNFSMSWEMTYVYPASSISLVAIKAFVSENFHLSGPITQSVVRDQIRFNSSNDETTSRMAYP